MSASVVSNGNRARAHEKSSRIRTEEERRRARFFISVVCLSLVTCRGLFGFLLCVHARARARRVAPETAPTVIQLQKWGPGLVSPGPQLTENNIQHPCRWAGSLCTFGWVWFVYFVCLRTAAEKVTEQVGEPQHCADKMCVPSICPQRNNN